MDKNNFSLKNSPGQLVKGNTEEIPATTAFAEVFDINGNSLGNIKQIIGNHSSEIEFALFQFKDSLGLGKKSYLIPWDIFKNHASGSTFVLDKNLDFIRNAPSFHINDWPDHINEHLQTVSEYWHQ
jgi:hypothetical protein